MGCTCQASSWAEQRACASAVVSVVNRLSMSGMSVGCFQADVQNYMNGVIPRQAEKAHADQQTD